MVTAHVENGVKSPFRLGNFLEQQPQIASRIFLAFFFVVVRGPRTHGFGLSFRTTKNLQECELKVTTNWPLLWRLHRNLFGVEKAIISRKKNDQWPKRSHSSLQRNPSEIPFEKLLHSGMFYWHFQKQEKRIEVRCFRVSFFNATFCTPFWGRNLPVFEPEKDFYGIPRIF